VIPLAASTNDISIPLTILFIFLKVAVVVGGVLLVVILLVWGERRTSAFIQGRLGPNRVGPFGLLQPLADAIKLIFKEDLIPGDVDKVLFVLSPALIFVPAFLAIATIPFGDPIEIAGHRIALQIADLNIGILYILAVAGLTVYGVVFGSFASKNKYSLMGGLRGAAQLVSYEVTLGLSIIGILMVSESLRLNDIVAAQSATIFGVVPRWNIFVQPLAFILFMVAVFAENNRLPFDLPEAEAELVGGYHTEYSAMKFALFMQSEYVAMFTNSSLIVLLFFGGWHLPGIDQLTLPPIAQGLVHVGIFAAKLAFFLFFFLWVRWTLPRFRYDQLMRLGWKVLLPLVLLNIVITGIVMAV